MIVYKVVAKLPHYNNKSRHLNEYRYMSSNIRASQYELFYELGKRTSAPRDTTGIFVFKTLAQAKWFARANHPVRDILKVQTDKRYVKEPRYVSCWLKCQQFPIKNKFMWSMFPPTGTLTVPSIIPLEEVTPHY